MRMNDLMPWNELEEKKQEKVFYKLFYKSYLCHYEENEDSTL